MVFIITAGLLGRKLATNSYYYLSLLRGFVMNPFLYLTEVFLQRESSDYHVQQF